MDRRQVVGCVDCFRIFFIFPSGAPRSIPGVRAKKKKSNPLDAPDDPSHFHAGRDLSVRRVKISATGYAADITGVAAGTAGSGAARDPSSVREIARLRDDLGAGMATPMAGRTAPLRATLEHAYPAP
jgi:hypothetical protein